MLLPLLLPLHIICIALLLHVASVAIVVIAVVVVGHIKCMALCSWAADELPAVGGSNTGQPAKRGPSIHPSSFFFFACARLETCINLTFFLCLPVGVEVQMGPGVSLEINCGFALIYLALFAVVRIQFFVFAS